MFPDFMMRAFGFGQPFHICKYTPGQILICNEVMKSYFVRAQLQQLHADAKDYIPFTCDLVSFSIEDGTLSKSQIDRSEINTDIDQPSLLSWNVEISYLATANTLTNVISVRHIDVTKVVKSSSSEPTECALPSCDITTEDQELERCSRCRQVAYCSKEHLRLHWREHKPDCNLDNK